MREGSEIEKIIEETYEKALEMNDRVKALEYFNKTFNGLEKAGYNVSEYRHDSFDLIIDDIITEGEVIAEEESKIKGVKLVGDNFKRLEKAGYNISEYKLEYWEMFERYTGMKIIESLYE